MTQTRNVHTKLLFAEIRKKLQGSTETQSFDLQKISARQFFNFNSEKNITYISETTAKRMLHVE